MGVRAILGVLAEYAEKPRRAARRVMPRPTTLMQGKAFCQSIKFMKQQQEAVCPRRRGESAQAHRVATEYCQMGLRRSIAKVAERLGKSKSMSRLEKWSARYKWVERAAVFDEHQNEQRMKEFDRRVQCAIRAGRQIRPEDLAGI